MKAITYASKICQKILCFQLPSLYVTSACYTHGRRSKQVKVRRTANKTEVLKSENVVTSQDCSGDPFGRPCWYSLILTRIQMARPRKLIKRSPKKPSFFKILIGDFSQRLRIPPRFIENFNGQSLRKCALRGPSRQWWDVKLEERENSLFFRDGWQGFVKDHVLEVGDLMVFSYNGKSKFKVKIFDRSACEKNVKVAERTSGSPVSLVNKGNQAQVKEEIVELDTEDCENKTMDFEGRNYKYRTSKERPVSFCVQETSTGSILFKSKNPCFLAHSRKQHLLYRVMIPKKLAVAEGLMRRDAVMLQDPTGRSWLVELRVECFNRLAMALGWTACRKANQISPGDSIIFELVKQGVMQIHIFRKGAVGGNRLSVITAAPNVKN